MEIGSEWYLKYWPTFYAFEDFWNDLEKYWYDNDGGVEETKETNPSQKNKNSTRKALEE